VRPFDSGGDRGEIWGDRGLCFVHTGLIVCAAAQGSQPALPLDVTLGPYP
jgi:hypothetical protein